MPYLPFRIGLFLSSYAPLFGLLAYTSRDTPWTWGILAGVAAASVLVLIGLMAYLNTERGPVITVAQAQPRDGDVLAYIATYLIPFFGVDLSKGDDRVVFVSFLVVLGIVYTNSNMLFVNPLLSLAGYHLFDLTDADGHSYTLLTRRDGFASGAQIRPAQIGRYMRVEVRPHDSP